MTPQAQASILARVVDVADAVLSRPLARAVPDEKLAGLYDEVAAAAAAPVESAELRFVDPFAVMLAKTVVLLDSARAYGDPRATGFAQVAGVLLPLVREAWSRALQAMRTVRPTP